MMWQTTRSRSWRSTQSLRVSLILCASFIFSLWSVQLAAQKTLSFESRTRVLETWIAEHVEYHQMPGAAIAVVMGDQTVWSATFGSADVPTGQPMTSSTRLRMGSVSKIFTSTAIMQLRDDGRLSLDDPVRRYLPWFRLAVRDPQWRGESSSALGADGERYALGQLDGSAITIRHLLTHTSGLPREAAVPYWTDHVFPVAADLAEIVGGQVAIKPPGFDYQYSNLGLGLLGQIVEIASGQSLGQFLEARIFAPLGMSRSTAAPSPEVIASLAAGYMRRLPDGSRPVFEYYDTASLAGAANVISTLDDMTRFAALHLHSADAGRVEDRAPPLPLSAASLEEMQTPHWMTDSLSSGRGLGWSVSERDGRRVASHGGWIAGHRSHLIVVPEADLAVIAMVNADDVSPSFFAYEALDVLLPSLESFGVSDTSSNSAEAFSETAMFADLEGTYSDPWGAYYDAMQLGSDLYFYEHSYPPSDHALGNLTWLEPLAEVDSQASPDGHPSFVFGTARDALLFERDGKDVVRIKRRSDFLFPLRDGQIVMPRQ